MIRFFQKKATQAEMKNEVREVLNITCERWDKLFEGLKTQKKMLDILINHLGLEPVTTTTITGSNPSKINTETIFRKKSHSKKSKPEGDNDD